jgi:myo-inositol-1(or 4)-monophosphatase
MTVRPDAPVDLVRLKELLIEAAAIVARFYSIGTRVTHKADGSPLTEADTEVNEFLRAMLRELLPEAAWLSEETADDLVRLSYEWLWIVDPLDGTKEFARRIPEFAISVGLVHHHEAVVGGVINPASGEGGLGEVGGKVEFWGGLRSRPVIIEMSESVTSLSRTEVEDGSVERLVGLLGSTRPVGSVAYKLLRVAAGQDDLTLSVQPKSEWDICGGVALINGVGKEYRCLDGNRVRFNQRDTRVRSGAVAGDRKLVSQFISSLERHTVTSGETR